MARSSVLVTAIGFDPRHVELLAELARRADAATSEFKGHFNLWLHFENLPHPEAREVVRQWMSEIVEDPEAYFMF